MRNMFETIALWTTQ